MVLSDNAGKTGLIEDVDFWCDSNSTSYPTADKIRNINRHYYVVVSDIARVSGRAQFDDSNLATLPKVDLTMVEGTNQVALPDANLKIEAVEILDVNGTYVRIPEIDLVDKQSSISSYTTQSGFPEYYDVLGAYIYLSPAPTATKVTLTSGLRLWVLREVDAFTAADTTQEPGFAEPFHRILSLGAAHDFLIVNGPQDKADRVLQKYEQMRQELKKFYADKNRDITTRIRTAHRQSEYH